MKISGEATLHAPVDKVYAALNDPAVLVRTIPGCERLDRVGPDSYRMVVTAGVAAVKGTYAGEVALTDREEPHGFVLKASGSGAPGTVSAQARVRLAPGDGGATTTLTYDADAVVGGMVGGVGQRLLTGVAKKTAGEFFAAVDDVLTGAAVEPAAAEPGAAFVRPTAPARAFPGGDLAAGVVLGAAAALAGVVVGALIARGRK
jgi:carbon monoxide dehydrogenase subunit G